MKQTTCCNLRGACDALITGETAEAMGAASKQDVMQMLQAGSRRCVQGNLRLRAQRVRVRIRLHIY